MNLELQDFEGPFDLLLHLVRASKMDIYTINIREIIEQYLDFINSIPKENIDASSEYLVMASELIHLKSKLLVGVNDDDNDLEESEYSINSEEELRIKIIEYEKYKNMVEILRSLEENRQAYYTKLPESLKEYTDNERVLNSDVTIEDLTNAFLELQKRVEFKKPMTTKVARKEYSIKLRIKEIRDILKSKKKIEFFELFTELTKENIVVTFLSLLDMAKLNEIKISQDKTFSKIIIESK